MGQYNLKAFAVVVDRVVNGRKAKAKYFTEPMLWKYLEDSELTDEEREKKETAEAMRQKLASMDAWIAGIGKKSLTKPKIK